MNNYNTFNNKNDNYSLGYENPVLGKSNLSYSGKDDYASGVPDIVMRKYCWRLE